MNTPMPASPWDALLRHSTPRRASPVPAGAAITKTAQLLQIIEQRGRVPTLALCVELDLPSRLVWGLLKTPRQTGQVRFDGTHWAMGFNQVPVKVQRAARVLRAAGWTVVEPPRDERKS